MPAAYRVALASRGGGAFTYTYRGPDGLGRGQLCAVRFRSRIEIGVVIDADDAPPAGVPLQQLCPVSCTIAPQWGRLMLDLCELACAAPHEIVPRLTPTGTGTGLRLQLTLSESAPLAELAPALVSLAGSLPPGKRRLLADEALWEQCCCASEAEHVELELVFTGQPGVSSATPGLSRWYELGDIDAALLGLVAQSGQELPGGYLAGLPGKLRLSGLKRLKDAPAVARPDRTADGALNWDRVSWPPGWDVVRNWPGIAELMLSRTQVAWPQLRHANGLLAELQMAVAQRRRVLLLAPQAWMLDRLWPELAALAPWLLRHRSEDPPGAIANLLYRFQRAEAENLPLIVAGTEAAWRLTAYGRFDRAILIDPSHPQWAVETTPWIDPRAALLLGLAAAGTPRLCLIELALSAFDGKSPKSLRIDAPFEETAWNQTEPVSAADTNPLPLHLRQPGLRRLVYFNRLGVSRGLVCAECQSSVGCPQCRSRAIHYSRATRQYVCSDCGFTGADLRCPRCGLAALMAHLPGLEALQVRPGEHIVAGGSSHPAPEHHTVLGTAQLLEPIGSFWPQQIVYVDPDERDLPDSDGRSAIDMAQRLASLYANEELSAVHIVSARLADRLAPQLTPDDIRTFARQEDALRRLGGLPPYGCLYRFRALADTTDPLHAVRELLGAALSQHAGTTLLRLGKPFARQRRAELHGWLLNPQITWQQWQALRWEVVRLQASLGINPRRGTWL